MGNHDDNDHHWEDGVPLVYSPTTTTTTATTTTTEFTRILVGPCVSFCTLAESISDERREYAVEREWEPEREFVSVYLFIYLFHPHPVWPLFRVMFMAL
jgi:hypothetical protein